jgi:hypothetical protein
MDYFAVKYALYMLISLLSERKRRRKLRINFRRSGSEFLEDRKVAVLALFRYRRQHVFTRERSSKGLLFTLLLLFFFFLFLLLLLVL